ncbi:hypothetical protein B0H14DRAFT_2873448 [Mycena olivaceomarginata]|nr:hypothetical protein B0H14DRAFT_2873448 [Mycena olivaceomarginata]
MAPSVLIIGASGVVGRPLSSFASIAVLSDPTKVSRFAEVQSQGVKLVTGSFLEASSYKGFDTVISLVGNATLKLQPGIIDAAIAGVATREHLRDRAREIPGFAYTLLMTGGFTEFTAHAFNAWTWKSIRPRRMGRPTPSLRSPRCPSAIMRYIVQSVLLPLEPGQSARELRVAGETLTWGALMKILEEVQGVRYDVTYLDPRDAAEKEEAARVAGTTRQRFCGPPRPRSRRARLMSRVHSTTRASRSHPESARETLERLFGKK